MSSGVVDPALRVGALPSVPPAVRLGGRTIPAIGTARLYVCGITPYDVAHIGHASTFVWADLLAQVLDSTGVRTEVCRNVTDVDDALLRAAMTRGRPYDELALTQEAVFEQSMRALRVGRPAHQPRARHHVVHVQQLAQRLLDRGRAYERDGVVRFRGRPTFEASGLTEERALALSEEYGDNPHGPGREDPFDTVLWMPSGDQEPAWPSPWGWGRPGWHAECAAMAMAIHGAVVDVQAGGEDLAWPHHAMQAAMVEAASGVTPFAQAALHVGAVHLDGRPMAKSTGNLVLVDDVLADHAPALLRLVILDRPYAEPWHYDAADFDVAAERLERLYRAAAHPGAPGQVGVDRFEHALGLLHDDLDVTAALDAAEHLGGEAARRMIALMRLG